MSDGGGTGASAGMRTKSGVRKRDRGNAGMSDGGGTGANAGMRTKSGGMGAFAEERA